MRIGEGFYTHKSRIETYILTSRFENTSFGLRHFFSTHTVAEKQFLHMYNNIYMRREIYKVKYIIVIYKERV